MDYLRVQAEKADRYVLLTLDGELDLISRRKLLWHLGDDTGGLPLVFDLSGLTFTDHTGPDTIVATWCDHAPGVRVVITDENVRRMFQLTLADTLVPIYQSVGEALRSLADPTL